MKKLKTFLLLICLFMPLMFAGCENTSNTTLSVPENFIVEADGLISFDMVENAEYYQIVINDTSLNVFPTADENNHVERVDNKLIYDASRIFVLGESYDVKVKARAEKKSSSFSDVVSYTHAITMEKAENMRFNGTVLTWDMVEHASYYSIKVVAPYDNILNDSPSNIAAMDLTEYHFSANRFDFSSLVTSAGEYKFYINSISLENNRLDSGYTNKVVYTNKINLKTPKNSNVYKITEYNANFGAMVDNYHLLTVVDSYTNAVNVNINGVVATAYLDGNYINVKYNEEYGTNSNVVDINLSTLFEDVIDGGLNSLNNFSVSAQSAYRTSSVNYYINSSYSTEISVENKGKINTPTTTLSKNLDTDLFSLIWNVADTSNISGFKVYIATGTEVSVIDLRPTETNFTLPANFTSACVQAIAKGNFLSSNLSEPATISSAGSTIRNFECEVQGNEIVWTQVQNAKYLVELNKDVYILEDNKIDISNLTKAIENFSVTVLRDNVAPVKFNADVKGLKKSLSVPSYLRFDSNSLYVLNFNEVENAIGYYVYLKASEQENYEKIQTLFTDTTISLANYITDGKLYQVKVKAVADKYSIYKESELSNYIDVKHQQTLEKPQYVLDENNSPIIKVLDGTEYKFILRFTKVAYANKYEVLVNFNSITHYPDMKEFNEVDITNLITGAGQYTIMVRALPVQGAVNIQPSDYNIFDNCIVTKQLSSVKNVQVKENSGVYSLSFETVQNAEKYQVRIIKVNDDTYSEYLTSLGKTPTFEVLGSCDISEYVKKAGKYLIYVTALAAPGGYYANSDEANSYTELNKLTTLQTPTELAYLNNSTSEYYLKWLGDENADYFTVEVIDPNNAVFEYKVLNTAENQVIVSDQLYIVCNINSALSIQGNYKVSINAVADYTNDSYTNSPYCEQDVLRYEMFENQDFERKNFNIYGKSFNYSISSAEELKNALWYNYLYEIDEDFKLKIKIEPISGKTIEETIAVYASQVGIEMYVSNSTVMLTELCNNLLNRYPELHVLTEFEVHVMENIQGDLEYDKFVFYYKNGLNGDKIKLSETIKDGEDNTPYLMAYDYAPNYNYIAEDLRRSELVAFEIDKLTNTMNVTTTEQLLHAVQYGYRPIFVGDCVEARNVYENAKQVLRKIVGVNMTELEKTTAIYDWLSYAINVNFNSEYYMNASHQLVNDGNISGYGKRIEYYLESVFLNINDSAVGGWDGEFYLSNKAGTSDSYSKAFTLLCAIEGIETRKVNGTFTVEQTIMGIPTNMSKFTNVRHSWNKVKVQTSSYSGKTWYALDLRFSDVSSFTYDALASYGVSSHAFYLVSDSRLKQFYDIGYLAKNDYRTIKISTRESDPTYNLTEFTCNSDYNYYQNTSFKIGARAANEFVANAVTVTYNKQFSSTVDYYNNSTASYAKGDMSNYIWNNLVYACTIMPADTNRIAVEFRYSSKDYNSQLNNVNSIISSFNSFQKKQDIQLISSLCTATSTGSGDDTITTYTYMLVLSVKWLE